MPDDDEDFLVDDGAGEGDDFSGEASAQPDWAAQIAAERKARQEAVEAANAARSGEHAAKLEATEANLSLLRTSIETVSGNQETLKSDYSIAMSHGDFQAAAEIQQTMADNAAILRQLETGKDALEKQPKPQAPTLIVADPVEAMASRLHPQSAKWLRDHPQYATDTALNKKMLAAHQLSILEGIAENTPEYFDFVEGKLGLKGRASDASSDAAKVVQQRSSAPPVAPVGRDAPASSKNRVTLSSAERQTAEDLGMTAVDYAANKAKLIKEGRLQK
jgi:hypothetical protein